MKLQLKKKICFPQVNQHPLVSAERSLIIQLWVGVPLHDKIVSFPATETRLGRMLTWTTESALIMVSAWTTVPWFQSRKCWPGNYCSAHLTHLSETTCSAALATRCQFHQHSMITFCASRFMLISYWHTAQLPPDIPVFYIQNKAGLERRLNKPCPADCTQDR